MLKMHKKTVTKEDGRLLTFYTFGVEQEEIAHVELPKNTETGKPAGSGQPK